MKKPARLNATGTSAGLAHGGGGSGRLSRRLIPGQVNSFAALHELGERLQVYASISVPTVLLGTDRSPAHLAQRLDALAHVLPNAQRIVLRHRDHGADLKHPRQLAAIIAALADQVGLAPSV